MSRFTAEVASAVASEIGADRTGLRISPGNPYNDITEHDAHDVYPVLQRMRRQWSTAPIVNRADAPLVTRFADLDSGLADVVTVGAAALATPPTCPTASARVRPSTSPTRSPSTAATTAATPTTRSSPQPLRAES